MNENRAAAASMTDHVEQFWRELDTNQVRILVELKRDGYWDSSSYNDEVSVALVEERITARSTISEQEKRIAELEAVQFTPGGDNHHNALKCPYCNPQQIDPEYERQRREEADKTIRKMMALSPAMSAPGRFYFLKYEPIPADREEEDAK